MQGQSRGADGTAKLLSGHCPETPRFFPFQPRVTTGKFSLDGVGMLDRLRGLGAASARDALPEFQKYFLDTKAGQFTPFS